jgi:hypothetical protein
MAPLLRPDRVGEKDIPATYFLFVDFISSDDEIVYHQEFTPQMPTPQWPLGNEISETIVLEIPPSISPETYFVRVGLVNPKDENDRINLITPDRIGVIHINY